MKTTFIPQQAIISTPPQTVEANYIKLYRKADGCWYELDNSGVERSVVCPKYIEITQSAHGITMLGSSNNVFVPGHIDDASGLITISDSSATANEAFGLIEVVDSNVIRYHTTDSLIVCPSHGYQVGAILYLQDDGTLGTTQGTLAQKIYEVLTPDLLQYLKQPMWSMANNPNSNGVARIEIPAQTITNVGAVWNSLTFGTVTFDTIGLTVGTNSITVPNEGTYSIQLIANVFDNNSARVAHETELQKNGGNLHTLPSSIQGNNYMRDATAHDTSHLTYTDMANLDAADVLSFRNRTSGSVANTTDITGGWIIIKKEI